MMKSLDEIKSYLDERIRYWQERLEDACFGGMSYQIASDYLGAFQQTRKAVFGRRLGKEKARKTSKRSTQ